LKMILNVKVVPNAKKELLKQESGRVKVYLNAPAVEGKANKALVEFLAKYYKIKKSSISIIRGEKAREKVVQISEE